MANDQFLPNINLTLNDLGLRIAPPPAGPKLTLLGITSNTGIPLREPMTVSSAERAMNALWFSGDSGPVFPGELSLAVEQAVIAGAPNIEVIVTNWYTGLSLFQYTTALGTGSRFSDLSGSYEVLKNRDIDVVHPVGVYIDDIGSAVTATKNYGVQLSNFLYQTTKSQNSAIGVIATAPIVYWAQQRAAYLKVGPDDSTTGSAAIASEVVGLTGTGVTGQMRYVYFATPSTALTNEWFAHNANVHANTGTLAHASGSFVTRVWTGAAYHSAYDAFLHGSYDSNGLHFAEAASSSQLYSTYFTYWQAKEADGSAAVDGRGVRVDAGQYISVVAAPVKVATSQTSTLAVALGASIGSTFQTTDGAASYGGSILRLAPQSATTNKFVEGLIPLKQLGVNQVNVLTGLRLVTMYTRSRGFVVASGVTGAYNVNRYLRSDFVRLTTVRIVQTTVDLIRSVGEKFLGEPNNAPQMNALSAEIDQVLLSMKSAGALNQYDFTVTSTPEQRVLGQLDVNLTLVPAFEITQINLTVSLADSI